MLKLVRYALTTALTLGAAVSYAGPRQGASTKPAKKRGVVDQMSGQGYGMAGCGLGSILFGEREGMVQVFASTTNGIYSNHTFAMTSGTSNCAPEEENGDVAAIFVEGNRQALENDIARGRGETLSTLAGLMGCSNSAHVGEVLKESYRKIFPNAEVNNRDVVNSIKEALKGQQEAAGFCSHLS